MKTFVKKNKTMIHTNIQVYDFLQPYYKWNLVSIAFCDRMLMVMISSGCSEKEYSDLKKYLYDNNFFKHEDTNLFYRFKSRSGQFIEPDIFDKENGQSRIEMTKRFVGRQIGLI